VTQPLLAGSATDLAARKGQAMGLNLFLLFTESGLGSLLCAAIPGRGRGSALILVDLGALLAATAAVSLCGGEVPRGAQPSP